MPRTSSLNPFAFVPLQVTLIGSATYVALFAVLLYLHLLVPTAPSEQTSAAPSGINLTHAWHDLQDITAGYHPWGSRANDRVRDFLNARIVEILTDAGAEFEVVFDAGHGFTTARSAAVEGAGHEELGGLRSKASRVTVFANDTSNITALDDWQYRPWTQYVESANILVYIRGIDDTPGDWWNATPPRPYTGRSGVLVNAHYDSVSTGFGATDDGIGVVTILQLISHFSRAENQPRRGIVALLNNGEEQGLLGARAFMRHPLSRLPHTFLNLEGAGAGGRAMLFRSTDAEVTRMYAKSPRPYGTVVSLDGLRRGFVRSGTDYSVFTQELGMRGLDVAFFEPRSRYHTSEDDARDTSVDSLWHMLSASLETVRQLSSYEGDEFEGSSDQNGRLALGAGSDGVWFDMFGRAFAVIRLHVLFALSVSLLVAGPVILIVLETLLRRNEKWYLFAHKQYLHSSDDDDFVRLHGRRGFTRFPIAVVFASAAVVALAVLLTTVNPYILYSSQYAVWAMMLSAWFSVAWFFFAGSASIRPTALHRAFVLLWLYALTWLALVATTVGEKNFRIASGYFVVIMNASVFLALLISYLEMCALPSKTKYTEQVMSVQLPDSSSTRPSSQSSRQLLHRPSEDRNDSTAAGDTSEADERTSLLRGSSRRNNQTFTGFNNPRRSRHRQQDQDGFSNATDDDGASKYVYRNEQAWSASLPRWTWIVQFLVLVPINVIIIGQLALLLTSALYQTPADGNPVLSIYLFIAALAILLLLPVTPFLHRFTFHVPTFLFLVFLAGLVYSLLAFPFSRDARLKFFFVQQVNLDTGANNVSIIGLDGYIQPIAAAMPSTADQHISCHDKDLYAPTRSGLTTCTWPGLAPQTVPETPSRALAPLAHNPYTSWLDFNITTPNTTTSSPSVPTTATFTLRGRHTKQCRILFPPSQPITNISIAGAAPDDPRLPALGPHGSTSIFLFARDWDKTFAVTVSWPQPPTNDDDNNNHSAPLTRHGRIACAWSDPAYPHSIPALEELRAYAPVWATVTKHSDGLVEGWREWRL